MAAPGKFHGKLSGGGQVYYAGRDYDDGEIRVLCCGHYDNSGILLRTGYALARVEFPGRKLVFSMVILVFLLPRQSLLLAQYIYFNHFDVLGIMNLFTEAGEVNLINNPLVLVLLAVFGFGVSQSLFIFLFSQFFKNIPKELEEAALIDGCGFYRTYFKIMIPNAVPIISTV